MILDNILTMEDEEVNEKFERIASSSRDIFSISDDLIIKCPFSCEGHLQNENEMLVYSKANAEELRYLCPIIDYKKGFNLIMKKAIPLTHVNTKEHSLLMINFFGSDIFCMSISFQDKKTKEVIDRLMKRFDLYPNDMYKLDNWGIFEGRIVLIDYGCTNEIWNEYYEDREKD
jgi:hypothetical protein